MRSADKIAYIRQGLRIYDLKSKYYDMVDGHAPGVDFKIRNVGDRTLSKVVVRVIFYDSEAKAIAEEDYTPVLSSKYISNDDAPLRPNYIWQQKSGQIFSAKSVPSEWKEGSVRASIVDIEFDSQ